MVSTSYTSEELDLNGVLVETVGPIDWILVVGAACLLILNQSANESLNIKRIVQIKFYFDMLQRTFS